ELDGKSFFTNTATAASCPVWIFYLKGAFISDNSRLKNTSLFYGQTNRYSDYSAFQNAQIFGVQFHPYALSYLFSIPTVELTNSILDVQNLLGKDGKELEEHVFLAETIEERARLISNYFESRLSVISDKDHSIIAAIETVNQSGNNLNMDLLSKRFCLSQRQFERRFKELSGFSPISYSRIVRFEKALNSLISNREFTDIALAHGYYDQAHFNNDFKSFTGYNPKKYLKVNELIV
ncbi:helix-turn-helix domain-containing protein, partial [Fluviicola sp.]|uniref:helix-turn-helix domain-containing protein n=1 Tax=Fluviicola sp. TaxID=1917219 RepID=UPI00262087DF